MSDQCRNCTIRGDIKKCLETDCFQHEDWWAQTVLAQFSEAQGEISKLHTSIEEYEIENDKWRNYYNNLKQENAALRAELTEKEAELAELRAWKDEQLQVESTWDIQQIAKEMSLQWGSHIRRNILPYIKKLKAENSELRNRLKPVMDEGKI